MLSSKKKTIHNAKIASTTNTQTSDVYICLKNPKKNPLKLQKCIGHGGLGKEGNFHRVYILTNNTTGDTNIAKEQIEKGIESGQIGGEVSLK